MPWIQHDKIARPKLPWLRPHRRRKQTALPFTTRTPAKRGSTRRQNELATTAMKVYKFKKRSTNHQKQHLHKHNWGGPVHGARVL